jgi:hypothetical protein
MDCQRSTDLRLGTAKILGLHSVKVETHWTGGTIRCVAFNHSLVISQTPRFILTPEFVATARTQPAPLTRR